MYNQWYDISCATLYNMAQKKCHLHAGYLKQVYIHNQYINAYCFSTATMVTRKRLTVRYMYTTCPFNPFKRKNYVNRT